jgi:hypothetical protein
MRVVVPQSVEFHPVVGHREGKAPTKDGEPSRRSSKRPSAQVAEGPFMAKARRARPPPQQAEAAAFDEEW